MGSADVPQGKSVRGTAFPSLKFELCLSPRSCDCGWTSDFQTVLCVVRVAGNGSIDRDMVA